MLTVKKIIVALNFLLSVPFCVFGMEKKILISESVLATRLINARLKDAFVKESQKTSYHKDFKKIDSESFAEMTQAYLDGFSGVDYGEFDSYKLNQFLYRREEKLREKIVNSENEIKNKNNQLAEEKTKNAKLGKEVWQKTWLSFGIGFSIPILSYIGIKAWGWCQKK